MRAVRALSFLAIVVLLSGCQTGAATPARAAGEPPRVLAAETFLADIAQHIAGDRLVVDSLVPIGVDPHGFEPTPRDVRKVADSDVLIINGAGFETFLARLLQNAGGERAVIEAAAGLKSRQPQPDEVAEHAADAAHAADGQGETDPHFWMDPVLVIQYVENIRDGLAKADPAGAEVYAANAGQYIGQLKELDAWIVQQVGTIPPERRLLVTNHESLGYFADRYGFRVLGSVIPSVSTAASPSAEQLAQLANRARAAGARAIFVESGANPQMAEQLGHEVGIRVVSGLLTHSVTAPDGAAPDYISMIRYDVNAIVAALK